MALVPRSQRSQRSTLFPTSPHYASDPTEVDPVAMASNRPSHTERREQIAEQVEEQLNRQAEPKKKVVVDWMDKPEPPEIEPPEWTEVRESNAPTDLIARDAYNRRKGWERGKNEERYFARTYRHDENEIPYFRGKYETPRNSKVSDTQYWQSNDWLREATKRPKNLSAFKGAMNPRLIAALKRAQEEVPQEDRFLNSSHPILGRYWKGVKVLGRGGQGVVGLWEYIGPGTHPWGRRIVIKQSLQYPLDEERNMMMELGHGDSEVTHVVRLLYPIVVNRDVPPQLFRIMFEFCEGGDLNSLIIEHRKKNEPFSEENLWRFFECFAKGLNIMDHANESPERKQDSRYPMCHFDIKPLNILRGGVDAEHKFLPICKIADFGLAACIDPTNYTHYSRRRGTLGHYAPEQFSRRWTHRDAERCGHINVWGTHTNVWQIGILMYMLATLRGPPRPKGFRASAIGKKFTYGYKLHREKYSKALKALIWRCLCDKPKDRPDLRTLHKEIATALNAIKSRHTIAEQRLDPPEPRDPSKGPPPTTVPADAATGTRTAPFIVPGGVKVLRKMHFTFSVVPKHLPEGMQEPIWFRATPDSTLKQLKNTIRVDAGLKLTDDKQFIYMRVPGRPTILLDNMARMLSLYGVEQGVRLELWDSRKAHDEAEPDEPEFDVL